jgi:hypothetical protein
MSQFQKKEPQRTVCAALRCKAVNDVVCASAPPLHDPLGSIQATIADASRQLPKGGCRQRVSKSINLVPR